MKQATLTLPDSAIRSAADAGAPHWVATWACSTAEPVYFFPIEFKPQPQPICGSVRHWLRVSVGGSQLRIKVSNATGTQALHLGALSIARVDPTDASQCQAQPGSLRELRFGGAAQLSLAPGECRLSDVLDFAVQPLEALLISSYFPQNYTPGCGEHEALLLDAQNAALLAQWPQAKRLLGRPVATAIEVCSARPAAVWAVLGDSLVDGATQPGCTLRSWTDVVARRAASHGDALAVVNAGIGGNCLAATLIGPMALQRLDRDVFSMPGLSGLLLSIGINDLGIGGRSIDGQLRPMPKLNHQIAAYRQVIARARACGIAVCATTLMPFRDAFLFTEEKEVLRQGINTWMRGTDEFDAVFDFDAVVRDHQDASRLRSDYDVGDHLHLNQQAHQALGQSVDLKLLMQLDLLASRR